ncbi:MAG: hypothetical protein IBX56_09980 [Methylomicrobium sp.]|nr:hypothetical protein [Methylomicrobium sp.]
MKTVYRLGSDKLKHGFLTYLLFAALSLSHVPESQAGATFKIDETKWLSLGAGLRTSFTSVESVADGNWSNDFFVDNMRLYLNAQIHEYIKLEINSECQTCNDGGELRLLDAIGKFEFHPMANLWVGRMLVPAERREMNGPFYSAVHSIFVAGDRISGTPFEPADFNTTIRNDGTSAGSFGRDDGVTFWGSVWDGRIQYALGIFQGLRGGANKDDNLLYAQRLAFNFWEVEKNPGYYTSGTYYGKGGDILTLAVSNQYQEDGVGIVGDAGNFRGTAIDLLLEKVLGNGGVVTLNGEYKNYGIKGFSMASRKAGGGFAMFEGNAYDVSGMYLFPQTIGIGQFQPFVRFVNVMPIKSSDRNMFEAGVNYVIDGHNARIGLSWQYGDLMTKGLDYTDTAQGDKVNAFLVGFQYQI